MVSQLTKQGLITGRTVSPTELHAVLRSLCSKRQPRPDQMQLDERRRMMLSDLEAAATALNSQPSEPASEPGCQSEVASAALPSEAMPQVSGLEDLAELTDADVSRIRKTNETPPRVSIYDTIRGIAGVQQDMCSSTFGRLLKDFPEVRALCSNFKFPGQGQRDTPVTDAEGIVQIIMLLPSRTAAPVRAKVCQRLLDYLGASHEALHAALAAAPQPTPIAPPSGAVPQVSGLESLAELADADVSHIRKTNETPPRVSIYDVLQCVFGTPASKASRVFNRLQETFDAVHPLWVNWKFPGARQRETPVTDAEGIVQIIMLLPCRTAAPVRAKAAKVLVRYLGGDPSLVPEIQANRDLADTHLGTDASELCALLGVEEAVRVRTTGEGADKKFSLVDVARLVSGKSSRHAWEDVQAVMANYSEVSDAVGNFQFPGAGQRLTPVSRVRDAIPNFKFPGHGQRPTPVGDLRTMLLVVLRLRSRVAQKLSAKAVDVFVRYLGGDPALAEETLRDPEWQEHLTRAAVLASAPLPPLVALPEASGLEGLAELTDTDVSRIRKTNETPPRVSIYDTIAIMCQSKYPQCVWRDLGGSYPEVVSQAHHFKFPGQGQRETPVTDAEVQKIIMPLPCRTAAPIRAKADERFLTQ
jgi:hypothetical protein